MPARKRKQQTKPKKP